MRIELAPVPELQPQMCMPTLETAVQVMLNGPLKELRIRSKLQQAEVETLPGGGAQQPSHVNPADHMRRTAAYTALRKDDQADLAQKVQTYITFCSENLHASVCCQSHAIQRDIWAHGAVDNSLLSCI